MLDPEVATLLNAIYGLPVPAAPRYDIFEVFLTGVVSNSAVDVDGDPATPNPVDVDLNSQALNAGAAPFQPSEMLRLNMSIICPTNLDGTPRHEASRLGVIGGDIQGFPNGRRLADDVVDIVLLALAGAYDAENLGDAAPLADGDGVASNDNAFSDTFPYLAGPNTEAVNAGRDSGGGETEAWGSGYGTTASADSAGGVDASGGGTLVPALTGAVAALFIGVGAGSLIRSRVPRREDSAEPAV